MLALLLEGKHQWQQKKTQVTVAHLVPKEPGKTVLYFRVSHHYGNAADVIKKGTYVGTLPAISCLTISSTEPLDREPYKGELTTLLYQWGVPLNFEDRLPHYASTQGRQCGSLPVGQELMVRKIHGIESDPAQVQALTKARAQAKGQGPRTFAQGRCPP